MEVPARGALCAVETSDMTSRLFSAALAALLAVFVALPARAEGTLRIVQQYGTLYLPLHVIRDQGLIEKHGRALGLDIKVEWAKLSGGAAVNDALLSGAVDIAGAGIGPFLTLWDRTRGTPSEVRIVGALGATPNYLVTRNPNIKTLKDFTKSDRIALPAVGVSVQSRILQMAAEKEFGPGHAKDLDDITVTVPHPDAVAALLSGGTEINSHLGNSPFQEQELKDPAIRKVFSSYDVLGGPFTPTMLYATTRFKQDNPKTFKAFFLALEDATQWVATHRKEAAETYVRVENSKLDPAFIQSILDNPENRFTLIPLKSLEFAHFMHRIGALKAKPESWKDYSFEDLHAGSGS